MRAGARGSGRGAVAWVAWAAGIALALWLVQLDRRPAPVFADQFTHPDAAAVFVTALLPLEVSFALPVRPTAIRLPVWVEDGRRPLEFRLSVEPPGGDEIVTTTRVTRSGLAAVEVPPGPFSAVTLRLTITSDARAREQAPSVLWSRDPPGIPLAIRYADRPLDAVSVLPRTGPLFLLEYPWPTRWLLASWILVVAALPLLRRPTPRRRAAWLAALTLAATLTSVLLWQRDYTRRAAHLDADRYAESAARMAGWLGDPVLRSEVAEWFRAHPHASTQLVPALLAPFVWLGVPASFAFMLLSALAAWLALLATWRIAVAHLGLSESLGLGLTAAMACHPVLLRSFARPITDAFGLLLVVVMLWLLLRRLRTLDRRDEWLLAFVVLLHPLARPQGFAYWPFIAGAMIWSDWVREGGWPGAARVAARGLRVFGAPLLLLAWLYQLFDWSHNVELMLAKARRFRIDSTPGDFLASVLGVVQAMPLLVLLSRRPDAPRRRAEPAVRLLGVWALYAVGVLIAVRAPFWLRHFLPVLPVVYWLAGAWVADLRGTRRTIAISGIAAFAAANVAVTLWQIFHLESLPPVIAALTTVP